MYAPFAKLEKVLGEFVERDFKKGFNFSLTTDPWALAHGFQHEINVLDGVRYGNVKKTVCDICLDEDAEGNPVTEKWYIRTLWTR